MFNHATIERNATILLVLGLLTVAIGGIIEIAPLFYLQNTIEKVEGMRPYTPLELAGRNIYIREGCYTCHSQMIRPFRDETERYGHYSLAAESMFDHPFQWGSKRTGPDLARVGNRYSDDWHREHLANPRSVVPESVMPGYPFLMQAELDTKYSADHLQANRLVGVPYTDEMLGAAQADMTRSGKRYRRGCRRSRQALSKGASAGFRWPTRQTYRNGRAGRLPPNAGHAR